VSSDCKSLEFVTTRIENSRELGEKSHRILSADHIEETFSVARHGKDFVADLKRLKWSPGRGSGV
jgi:hypothetical protein